MWGSADTGKAAVSRLASAPVFLRHPNLWSGLLDPKVVLSSDGRYEELRLATASHRWGVRTGDDDLPNLEGREASVVDIALGLLERGAWAPPSWRMEQHLTGLFERHLGWRFQTADPASGNLALNADIPRPDAALSNALVTARWAAEATSDDSALIWESVSAEVRGSDAEKRFLEDVLIPVFGYPLLDYLHLQLPLVTMGADPELFADQRVDFALNSGRGLKLIFEIDGPTHADQQELDRARDQALSELGWRTWRINTNRLADTESLRTELRRLLSPKNERPTWGVEQRIETPRSRELMTCVWGATVSARIQFLLLESLKAGVLPWVGTWRVGVVERDTDIAQAAVDDLRDWFGRLRVLHGFDDCPQVVLVPSDSEEAVDIVVDVSVTHRHLAVPHARCPIAWSRPANLSAPSSRRRFPRRTYLERAPDHAVLESFVGDLFRKSTLREGQFDITSRILTGQDVIGLLPTGAGKSLAYQIAGLLLGGLTIYVSPLKSLIQDQRDRLIELGIDLVQEISSNQSAAQKENAGALLAGGGVRYLLVAPERFLIQSFRQQLDLFRVNVGEVCQVVIDECHCVSEWGHDFRPAYLSLSRVAKDRTARLGISSALVALTGTASTIVLSDVQRELGIMAHDAVIRARHLDRPEIALEVQKLSSDDKWRALEDLVKGFLLNSRSDRDGLLVFSRFVNRLDGVLGVTAKLLKLVDQTKMRFYCGEQPKWQNFAKFRQGRSQGPRGKGATLNPVDVEKQIPGWAKTPADAKPNWDAVKAKVQRDYLSGLKENFQVLVATHAFGMGIDKPSIRQVVHFLCPPSPEAYYQEVGRAGRDRASSRAILLFSDEAAGVTDQILDPARTIEDATEIFQKFKAKNKRGGGDFIQTFFFHQNAFSGTAKETRNVTALLAEVRRRTREGASLSIGFISDDWKAQQGPQDQAWNSEKNLEYSLVRLIHLGVVRDYTKDYSKKRFDVVLESEWESVRDTPARLAEYLSAKFGTYVRRYQIDGDLKAEQAIANGVRTEEIEATTIRALVEFAYDQIERKRRQATRQMLELARKGATDPKGFREDLLLYLQVSERFTAELERMTQASDPRAWRSIIESVVNPNDLRELHGACQRVLESFPTHPGLLAISSLTRVAPSEDGRRRSAEELRAALQYSNSHHGVNVAKEMGDAAEVFAARFEPALTDPLCSAYGLWLIRQGLKDEAIGRFMRLKAVRDRWLGEIAREARRNLPEFEEI